MQAKLSGLFRRLARTRHADRGTEAVAAGPRCLVRVTVQLPRSGNTEGGPCATEGPP